LVLNREYARVSLRSTFIGGVAIGLLVANTACAQPRPNTTIAATTEGFTSAGSCKTDVQTGVWRDARRNRDVPFLIRLPKDCGTSPAPVVIMSHGLGGSREGLSRLGERLASRGYIVVHPQHLGSDTSIWEGTRPQIGTIDRAAIARKVADPRVTLDRFLDIPFVLSQVRLVNQSGPLQGRFDLTRTAMAGHSFGAVTTQAMAGQRFPNGSAMPDAGFKAYIAMSPSGARGGGDLMAFSALRGPILFLTGSEDNFSISPQPASPLDRRKPYEFMPSNQAGALITLNGGDHFVFDGRAITGQTRPNDARLQSIIDAASVAFLDATLKNDAGARQWLLTAGFADFAKRDATLETKGWR
jgi:predicted dienelactone hydrolase